MLRRFPVFFLISGLLTGRAADLPSPASSTPALPAASATPTSPVTPTNPEPDSTLAELEARAPKGNVGIAIMGAYTAEVFRLIDSGALKTPEEFYRASNLVLWDSPDFRAKRVRYELTLAAAALGNADAEKFLPNGWDQMLHSLGRPYRVDAWDTAKKHPDSFPVDPAPASIQTVLRDPAAARTTAKEAKPNPEVKKIVDADQAARRSDWSKLSPEQMKAIGQEDRQRELRIREIVDAGELHTADDFAAASLVMQHSANFKGYQLAHELAVCSMLLGDRSRGRWLITATYDRMLGSVGHAQRFGTQFNSTEGGGLILQRVDEAGICDAERVALGSRTLEASRNLQPAAPRPRSELDNLSDRSDELQAARNFPEAEKIERPLLALARTDKTVNPGRLAGLIIRLAQTLNENGKFAEAEPLARESVKMREGTAAATTWSIFSARATLGRSLVGQKKYPEAEPLLLAAHAGLVEREASIPAISKVRIRDAAQALAQLFAATDREAQAREWRQKVAEFDKAH